MGFLPILGRDGRDVAWTDGVETHPGRGWRFGWTGLDDLISETTRFGKSKSTVFCRSKSSNFGFWNDFWPVRGNPEPGTYTGTALTFRQLDDTVAGGLPHGGNVSPDTKHVLWAGLGGSNEGRMVMGMLYDRVGTYEACPMNSSTQTMTNTLTPQRYTTSLGIMATNQVAITGASVVLSALTYTNQGGSSKAVPAPGNYGFNAWNSTAGPGQTAAVVDCGGAVAAGGGAPFLPLAAGDSGVQNVISYTSTTDATGTFCFVLGYPIAYFGFDGPALKDLFRACVAMERIVDGAHLSVAMLMNATVNINEFSGMFGAAWG
jgi:hypothetical protein